MRLGLPKFYLRSGLCSKPGNTGLSYHLVQRHPRLYRFRQLTYTNHLRQNEKSREQHVQKIRVQMRPERSESIQSETYQELNKAGSDVAPHTDALLSEQTVSNKEQRKADWAIMKEMARYLWPKVWQACIDRHRKSPNEARRTIWEQGSGWERLLHSWSAPR